MIAIIVRIVVYVIDQNYIEFEQYKLCVIEYIPDKIECIVYVINAYAQNKCGYNCMNSRFAKQLLEKGHACILIDYPGVGDSMGDLQDYDLRDYKKAIEYCVTHYNQELRIVGRNCVVVAIGMGMVIGAPIAKRLNARVIGWSVRFEPFPAADLIWIETGNEHDAHQHMVKNITTNNYLRSLGYHHHSAGGFIANRRLFEQLTDERPFELLYTNKIRTMLIYGEHDIYLRTVAYKRIEKQSNKLGWNIHIVSGADRYYSFADWQDEVIAETISWIDKRMRADEWEL